MDRHFSVLSALYYPDQHEAPAPGQLRSGAHTDFDALTILRPDEAPGRLQVMTKAGVWTEAPLVPGAFIVNIGDLLAPLDQRSLGVPPCTGSSIRRAPMPGKAVASRSAISRRSIQRWRCTPCPGTAGAGNPAKYPPITAGALHNEKFMRQARAAERAAGGAPPVV